MTSSSVVLSRVPTSWGEFKAVFVDGGLGALFYPRDPFDEAEAWAPRHVPGALRAEPGIETERLADELTAYFDGRLREFDVPLAMRGTPFQLRVWRELCNVRYGETRTYMQIAEALGDRLAVRAVGAANGANPIPVIVPCHRIIGANGKLVGYGGGLEMKRRLLQLEGVLMV